MKKTAAILFALSLSGLAPAWARPSLAGPFAAAAADFQKGNYSSAARFYSDVMATYKGSDWEAQAGLFLGQCLIHLGKTDQATSILQYVAQTFPQREEGQEAQMRLAEMAVSDGDVAGAEKIYSALGSQASASLAPWALLDLANLQARRHQYQKALDTFSRLGSQFPGLPWTLREALTGKAKVYRKLKRDGEALQAYQQAAKISPDGAAAAQDLLESADLYYQAGRFDKAVEVYRKVAAGFPNDSAEALAFLGRAYHAQGKDIQARAAFQKVQDQDASSIWADVARHWAQDMEQGEKRDGVNLDSLINSH